MRAIIKPDDGARKMSASNPEPAPGEIPASPDATAESAEAEAMAASGQGGDDALLGCLAFLCRYYERPRSPEVLKAGLPDAGKPLTPALAVRAAERAMIRERVMSGLERAKAQGKQLGRPRISGAKINAVRAARAEGKSIRAIAKAVGVSVGTVQRIAAQKAA